jgi:hypothetical protein
MTLDTAWITRGESDVLDLDETVHGHHLTHDTVSGSHQKTAQRQLLSHLALIRGHRSTKFSLSSSTTKYILLLYYYDHTFPPDDACRLLQIWIRSDSDFIRI